MSRADRFEFTLDEETEKRLYDLMTDIDTRRTNRFWIKDKRGYHAEYVKVVRCKDCRWFLPSEGKSRGWCSFSQHGYPNADDYCSDAEREEE